MSDFLQSWLKNAVLKIVNEVFTKDNSEIKIEKAVENVRHEECNRIQIAQFLKCPTEDNPFDKCLSYVIDKTNYIMAEFSTKALNKFQANMPDIPFTSLYGCFIILKKYNFTYNKESRQLQLRIDDFIYTSGGQSNVYKDELQSINEVPSIKTFLSVIYSRIKEEEKNKEVYHYGWKDIVKLSDEDCYISSEDRSILDNLPGWSEPDSPFVSNEDLNNNDDIINQNDALFNSQSIFEIIDFKPDNEDDDNQNENKKKSEKRYREVISDDMNSSGNEMNVEQQYNSKRIKSNNYEDNNNSLIFSQPIESIPNQDINMETNSSFSDHLSTSTDENLTYNFAPAGKYNDHSDHSVISENGESETDKETIFSNSYISNRDRNAMAFNTQKLIEKASFFGQFNHTDDNSDEILYESENLDHTDSPSFANNESWDTVNNYNLNSSQNSSNNSDDFDDNMISDNIQYIPNTNNLIDNISIDNKTSKVIKDKESNQKMIDETEKMLNQIELNFRGLKNPESVDTMIESLKMKLKSLKNNSSTTSIHSNSPIKLKTKSHSSSFSDTSLSPSSNNTKSKNKRKSKIIDNGKMDKAKNEVFIQNEKNSSNSVNIFNKKTKEDSIVKESSEKEKSNNDMKFEYIEGMLEQLNNPDIFKNIKKRDTSNNNSKESNKNENNEILNTKNKNTMKRSNEINKSSSEVSNEDNLNKDLELKDSNISKFVENSKNINEVDKSKGKTTLKNIENEKKRKVTKRKMNDIEKNTVDVDEINISEVKSIKKTRSNPKRSKSIIDKEKENDRNNNNGSTDKELKKKNSDMEKLESSSPNKSKDEEHGFKLYQKRMQEKKKKLQENNNKINESFTRINEQEKQINNEFLEQKKIIKESNGIITESINKDNTKQKKSIHIDKQNVLLDISPVKDNNNNYTQNNYESNNNNTNDDNNNSNNLDNDNLNVHSKNEIANNINTNTLNINNESYSITKTVINGNSANVTPIKPTSILKKSSTGSSKKKSVSFNTNIDIKIIPNIPQTKKVPIRSPKKSDDISSFFASLSPSKQSKNTIFSKYSSIVLSKYGLSPISGRKFVRTNKPNPSLYIKNNLFIDDKSLRNYSKTNNIEMKNNYSSNKTLEKSSPERKFAEVSKKLNQIFSIPFNSKSNESRAKSSIIKNISPNKDSLLTSPNKEHITNKIDINDDQPVNNDKSNNDDYTDKQQYKEIKSNTDVMEKIFLNDERETTEKNYDDFNILKKLVCNKEKNESDNKTVKNNVKESLNENTQVKKANNVINKSFDKENEQDNPKEKPINDNRFDIEMNDSNDVIIVNEVNNQFNSINNKSEKNNNIFNLEKVEDKQNNKLLVKNPVMNENNNNKNDEMINNKLEIICDTVENKKSENRSITNNSIIDLNDVDDDKNKDEFLVANDSLIKHDVIDNKNNNNSSGNKRKNDISIINNNSIINVNHDKISEKNRNESLITDGSTINNNNANIEIEELLFNIKHTKQNKFNIEKNESINLDINNDFIDENKSNKMNIQNINNVVTMENNKPITENETNDIEIISIDNNDSAIQNKFMKLDDMPISTKPMINDDSVNDIIIDKISAINDDVHINNESVINDVPVNNKSIINDVPINNKSINNDVHINDKLVNNDVLIDNNSVINDENNVIIDNNELLTSGKNNDKTEVNTNVKEIIIDKVVEDNDNQQERKTINEDENNKVNNLNIPEICNENSNINGMFNNNNNLLNKSIQNECLLSQFTTLEENIINDDIEKDSNIDKKNVVNNNNFINNNDNNKTNNNNGESNETISFHENIDDYMESNEYFTQNNDNLTSDTKNDNNSKSSSYHEIKDNEIPLNEKQQNNNVSKELEIQIDKNSNQLDTNDNLLISNEISKNNDIGKEICPKEEFVINEKEYEKGLQFIEKRVRNNKYYHSLKMFYDMFTPSNKTFKVFEIGNNKSKDNHDSTNITNCVCQDCMICKNRIFDYSISNNNFEIDYSNWEFY